MLQFLPYYDLQVLTQEQQALAQRIQVIVQQLQEQQQAQPAPVVPPPAGVGQQQEAAAPNAVPQTEQQRLEKERQDALEIIAERKRIRQALIGRKVPAQEGGLLARVSQRNAYSDDAIIGEMGADALIFVLDCIFQTDRAEAYWKFKGTCAREDQAHMVEERRHLTAYQRNREGVWPLVYPIGANNVPDHAQAPVPHEQVKNNEELLRLNGYFIPIRLAFRQDSAGHFPPVYPRGGDGEIDVTQPALSDEEAQKNELLIRLNGYVPPSSFTMGLAMIRDKNIANVLGAYAVSELGRMRLFGDEEKPKKKENKVVPDSIARPGRGR